MNEQERFDVEMRLMRARREQRIAEERKSFSMGDAVFYACCGLTLTCAIAFGPRYIERLSQPNNEATDTANAQMQEEPITNPQQNLTTNQQQAADRRAAYEQRQRIEANAAIAAAQQGTYREPQQYSNEAQRQAEEASTIYESMHAEEQQQQQQGVSISNYTSRDDAFDHECDSLGIGSIRERQCRENEKQALMNKCNGSRDQEICHYADMFQTVH